MNISPRIKHALNWCKTRERQLKRIEKAQEKTKALPSKRIDKRYSHLKRMYQLNKEDYLELLKQQEYKCALCGNKFKNNKDTQIDHKHGTSIIRGLLCFKCNALLGLANENPVILNLAIKYLEINYEKT
jgi:5-methylcytosine-specific restriction endonuclease McrA